MATTGIIDGRLLKIWKNVGGTLTPVACATECSISLSKSTRDITCKDSDAGYQDFLAGVTSGTISVSGLYSQSATNIKADALYDDFTAGTPVTIRFSTEVSGDTYYECQAIITSWEVSSPNSGDNVTYSATFQIKGAITKDTVA